MATVDLYPDFKEFLKSLNSAKVEYLVLGGYAVIHYGYRRMTDDLDVWIAVNPSNADKVSQVLQDFFGYSKEAAHPSLFNVPGRIFMFGVEPSRIDVLTGPSGIEFSECYSRRNEVNWDGVKVPLISFEDLKKNKIASGRAKDVADIENLPTNSPTKSATPRVRSRAKSAIKRKRRSDG